ncbi:MAG: hypothetical protein WAV09_04560 [Minisyncoccia bacterium]
MECVTHLSKTIKSYQYLNDNCLCDVKKLNTGYDMFFGNGAIFLSHKVFENIQKSIALVEARIKDQSNTKVNGGILMSYDFHIDGDIPKLIEINTNAGGIFLNHELALLEKHCCGNTKSQNVSNFEQKIVQMFRNEYGKKGETGGKLKTVAIMDENIQTQFLYPEILMCKEVLEKDGIRVFVVDSQDIEVKDGVAYCDKIKIDLIYNRNTDFYFENKGNRKFLQVLKDNKTIISPSPEDHFVFADKKNLVVLSHDENLKDIIPQTILVHKENQEIIWSNRKKYFFKPLNGYGGRGSYNGAGLTKKVWENILMSQYVAQEIVLPNRKLMKIDGGKDFFKFDIRAYTYNGEVLLLASRVYQGQTTNFRTKGGGFMPVFLTED